MAEVKTAPQHRCRVIGSPWQGVYAAELFSEREFHRHWHATYGIGLINAGGQRSVSGRGEVEALAGDLITTNPGEVHDGRPLVGSARSWHIVYIDPDVMSAQVTPNPERVDTYFELTQPVLRDAELRQRLITLLDRFAAWQETASKIAQSACDEALAAVCGQLFERHSNRRPSAAIDVDLRLVHERLADEWRVPPDLGELAAMTGLSRFQLLRRFQHVYGITPHAWLMQRRSETARGLIAKGTSLSEAAAKAGFSDQSHMNRMFVRSFGFTPGQYRIAVQ